MRGTENQVPPVGRHIGRALIVALVVATLAALAASRSATESSATSRVAVSDEVGWPFYTTARDSLLELALDPDVPAEVRRAVGADETTLELAAVLTGGEISVDLTARSPDAATAAEAANLYATEVVRRGAEDVRAEAEQTVADLQLDLENIDARTLANEAELIRIGALLDDVVAPPAAGARLLLESQIRRIDSAMAEDARRRTQIVQNLPEAGAAVDAPSDYEFVRAAREGAGGDVLSNATAMALLAGIPMFLIGLGASVLWDQTLGVVRRPRDVRWATDAPVFAIGGRPDGRIADPSPLRRRLERQQIPGSAWMIVPVGQSRYVEALSSSLAFLEGDRLTLPVDSEPTEFDRSESEQPDDAEPATRRRPIGRTAANDPDSTGTERTPAEVLTEARATTTGRAVPEQPTAVSGAVVAIVRNDVRLPRLRREIRDLELEGIPVEGVVIFGLER